MEFSRILNSLFFTRGWSAVSLKFISSLKCLFIAYLDDVNFSFKESGYDLSLSDYDDRTALHIAVSENQEHIVDFLLEDNPTLQAAVTETKDR